MSAHYRLLISRQDHLLTANFITAFGKVLLQMSCWAVVPASTTVLLPYKHEELQVSLLAALHLLDLFTYKLRIAVVAGPSLL